MFSDLYDKKYLFKCLVWLAAVFGLMRITGGAGFAIVIPMVLYCLLSQKKEALLFWLMVAICALIVNPHLVLKGGGFGWMQRGLMVVLGGVMSVSVMAYPMHRVIRPYAGMIIYVLFMALSSMQGWNPKISFLKLILFTLIYFAFTGVVNQVGVNPQVSTRRIRSVLLSVAVLFILGSVALVPFPGLSQLRASDFAAGSIDMSSTTSLFMGMTNQPQCLGAVVSATSVVLMGDFLFSIKKTDPLYILMLFCSPYLIYLTSSRTGMGSFIIGHMFVLWVFMNARGIGSRWKSRVMSMSMTILTLILIAFMCIPMLQSKVLSFVMKYDRGNTQSKYLSTEAVISSRQGLIDSALSNFKKKPLLGNGFQVSDQMEKMRGEGFMVLSAPIEKGVWVTAILEEGGVIGWTIFVVFLVDCIVQSIKRRAYIGASCLFVCMLVNLGEFTFFSMSFVGGYIWLMVFIGLALDMRKMKDENEEMRRQMESERIWMMNGGV